MKTTELGQRRFTKGKNLDIVIFIPGHGRVLTYNYDTEIAHVHKSKYQNQLCNLIYAQDGTEHVVNFEGIRQSVSIPNTATALNSIVALYSIDALTMMSVQRMLFLAVTGYENIRTDGSFVARNYTAGRSLSALSMFDEVIDEIEYVRMSSMVRAGDRSNTAMEYTVLSFADSSGLNSVQVLDKNRTRLIKVSENGLLAGEWYQNHRQNSIGGKTIGDVLMDVGRIDKFSWDNVVQLETNGQRALCKELVWRFHVDRSPAIGGNPVPEGKNIFHTSTTITELS